MYMRVCDVSCPGVMYHALGCYTKHATVMRIVKWLLCTLPIHFKHILSMVCLWTPLFYAMDTTANLYCMLCTRLGEYREKYLITNTNTLKI